MQRSRSIAPLLLSMVMAACRAPTADSAAPAQAGKRQAELEGAVVEGSLSIAAGKGHACALTTDETIVCWGRNENGQLGDGTIAARATPVVVEGLDEVVSVAAGSQHTCGVRRDGTVWCWGSNRTLALGDTEVGPRLRPKRVEGVEAAVEVVASTDGTCVVTSGGEVMCWGELREPFETDLPPMRGWVAMDGGWTREDEYCGLDEEDRVSCGPLGYSSRVVMESVRALSVDPIGVACSSSRTGTMQCWRRGDDRVVELLQNVVEIAGRCARRANGTVACGQRRFVGPPIEVDLPAPAVSLAVVDQESYCALGSTGEIMCWGRYAPGRVSSDVVAWTARDVSLPAPIVRLSSHGRKICAHDEADRSWCWSPYGVASWVEGATFEQPDLHCRVDGAGRAECDGAPIKGLGRIRRVVEPDFAYVPAAGCAVTRDGKVGCWLGPEADGPVEAWAIPGVRNVDALTVAKAHACARLNTGEVVCWDEMVGRRPDARARERMHVQTIATNAVEIVGGGGLDCMRDAEGGVRCWGRVNTGAFPCPGGHAEDGEIRAVEGLDAVVRLDASAYDVCGLEADGDLVCWGGSFLGHSACRPEDALRPRVLGRFEDATDLATGLAEVCVLEEGTVRCVRSPEWPPPDLTRFVPAPRRVKGLENAVELSSSNGGTACARRADGSVACTDHEDAILTAAFIERPGLRNIEKLVAVGADACGYRGAKLVCDAASGVHEAELPAAIVAVESTGFDVCALLNDGSLHCSVDWPHEPFVPVSANLPFTQPIASLGNSAEGICAIDRAGALACRADFVGQWGPLEPGPYEAVWGALSGTCRQSRGRIDCDHLSFGDGTVVGAQATGGRLALGSLSVQEIVFGDDHACILAADRTVHCWGHGGRGALGGGSYADTGAPTRVEGLDDVVNLATLKTTSGTCAVTARGEAWCWGEVGAPSPHTVTKLGPAWNILRRASVAAGHGE